PAFCMHPFGSRLAHYSCQRCCAGEACRKPSCRHTAWSSTAARHLPAASYPANGPVRAAGTMVDCSVLHTASSFSLSVSLHRTLGLAAAPLQCWLKRFSAVHLAV